LTHYETFVELVRVFGSGEDGLGQAIERAIAECVRRGILADFLKLHGSEVMNLLTAELDETKLRKLWVDYGVEMGLEQGVAVGREEGREEGTAAERARIVRLIERGASLDDLKKTLSAKKPPRKPGTRTPEKK